MCFGWNSTETPKKKNQKKKINEKRYVQQIIKNRHSNCKSKRWFIRVDQLFVLVHALCRIKRVLFKLLLFVDTMGLIDCSIRFCHLRNKSVFVCMRLCVDMTLFFVPRLCGFFYDRNLCLFGKFHSLWHLIGNGLCALHFFFLLNFFVVTVLCVDCKSKMFKVNARREKKATVFSSRKCDSFCGLRNMCFNAHRFPISYFLFSCVILCYAAECRTRFNGHAENSLYRACLFVFIIIVVAMI